MMLMMNDDDDDENDDENENNDVVDISHNSTPDSVPNHNILILEFNYSITSSRPRVGICRTTFHGHFRFQLITVTDSEMI